MLNISFESISAHINKSEFKTFKNLENRTNSKWLLKILLTIFVICILSLFLPWTQNIRSIGKVSTLNPYDKPQNIQSLIGGRIDKWYIRQGDIVQVGDTIAILTEAKEDYLDPQILDNTKEQQNAKLRTADAHLSKRNFLNEQLVSLGALRDAKLEQLKIKKSQIELKIATANLDLEAQKTYLENATKQLDRMLVMHEKGIKSLTDLETKRLSKREAEAKINSVRNKLAELENDNSNILREIEITNADYTQKYSKLESEITSADSYRYSALGESNKLQSKFNQIKQRQNAFVITSPIHGRITKVLQNGIGEYIKAQESIATIVPTSFQKAVDLYVKPYDMPLIQEGKKVRLQFDGWPAIVFSGWPDNSFGTFGGKVYAIDNDISENGMYRIIVIEDDEEKTWPELIRIGSGARGLLLLNDVKLYYEFWRKLNGFPPDFYDFEKPTSVKNKAPIKKVK